MTSKTVSIVSALNDLAHMLDKSVQTYGPKAVSLSVEYLQVNAVIQVILGLLFFSLAIGLGFGGYKIIRYF